MKSYSQSEGSKPGTDQVSSADSKRKMKKTEAGRVDLVITRDYAFDGRFSNRWLFDESNELVDYDCVTNWSDTMMNTIYPNLRRAKIRHLPARISMPKFLASLSSGSLFLEYLEVDKIHLDQNLNLNFCSLQILSIDSIEPVELRVQFISRQLRKVYLGNTLSFLFF